MLDVALCDDRQVNEKATTDKSWDQANNDAEDLEDFDAPDKPKDAPNNNNKRNDVEGAAIPKERTKKRQQDQQEQHGTPMTDVIADATHKSSGCTYPLPYKNAEYKDAIIKGGDTGSCKERKLSDTSVI